jgi:hypothetical protein
LPARWCVPGYPGIRRASAGASAREKGAERECGGRALRGHGVPPGQHIVFTPEHGSRRFDPASRIMRMWGPKTDADSTPGRLRGHFGFVLATKTAGAPVSMRRLRPQWSARRSVPTISTIRTARSMRIYNASNSSFRCWTTCELGTDPAARRNRLLQSAPPPPEAAGIRTRSRRPGAHCRKFDQPHCPPGLLPQPSHKV